MTHEMLLLAQLFLSCSLLFVVVFLIIWSRVFVPQQRAETIYSDGILYGRYWKKKMMRVGSNIAGVTLGCAILIKIIIEIL